jgi:2-oxoglutarate ferredoxin oxidoreductase subunit alpha
MKVARVHLRYLNPFPKNLGEVLARYRTVVVPELNRGHLWRMLRADFLVDAVRYSKMQGQPFKAAEIEAKLMETIGS